MKAIFRHVAVSVALALASSLSLAAQQTINVGSSANDGTGDTLRAAMQKTNANFTDLYTNKQPLDTELTCLAGLTSAADRLAYFTGSGTCALGVFTTYGRSVVAVADAAALQALADLEVGVDVQAYDSDLDTWSSKVPPSGTVIGTTDTQTLTNKTLTSPVINTPTGIVKGDVGLGNVDNTSNATERAATATLTNKTLTSPVINSPTGIVKGDVGLGNVDNTSNATERAATATLTNKTISGGANTLSNIGNSSLTNSSITINGTPTALGGTITLSAADVGAAGASSNSFTGNQQIDSTEPRYLFNETDQGTNEKLWDWDFSTKIACLRTRTDADAAGVNAFCATRGTGTALTNVTIGAGSSTFNWGGTGQFTIGTANTQVLAVGNTGGGEISVGAIWLGQNKALAGGAASAGIYRIANADLGIQTAQTLRARVDPSGNFIFIQATADQSKSVQVPTTGFAITIANNISTLILNPAGTLATGTITMPATPIDGQNVRFTSSQTITSLTVSPNSGQSIIAAPATLAPGIGAAYTYHLAGTTWYRMY